MGTTLGWYTEGGPAMVFILLVAVAGILVLIERFYVIVFRSKINGRAFIERVIQLVRVGKVDDAIKECVASKAALPDIGLLILRSRSRSESDLHNVAGAASLSVMPRLTHRLQYLSALATSAVLLGAAGALARVHNTLISAGDGPDLATHHDLGFAAACSPAVFGLTVAVVLVLGRSYLVSQSESIIEQTREFSARLINALIDLPDVRLGHR